VAKKSKNIILALYRTPSITGCSIMNKMYGLIFDVDGVIADTEPLNARVTIKVFEDIFGLKGVRPSDFAEGIGKGAEKFVKAAADVHGLQLTDEQIKAAARLREQYLIEAIRKEPLPSFPGVLEIINAALQRKDFRLAIATSATLELSRAILESVKVPYPKMVYITGSEITRKKPDPELFLTAAKRMEIVPADCVVFEDAPSGVQAAKAAGARCIAVTNSTTAENLSGADLICDSLEQINVGIIQKLIDAP
jgi:HAD superfamily hydrolase (TIGR01509 family)